MDNESLIVMQTKNREVNKSDENSTNEEEDPDDVAVDSGELSEAEVEENYDGRIEGIIGNESLIDSMEHDYIRKCIYKCRALIKMIGKSTVLANSINQWKKEYNVKCTLSIDFRSRWNSTLFLIETVLRHRLVIIRLIAGKYELDLNSKSTEKLTDLELTKEEWTLLKSLHQVQSGA